MGFLPTILELNILYKIVKDRKEKSKKTLT